MSFRLRVQLLQQMQTLAEHGGVPACRGCRRCAARVREIACIARKELTNENSQTNYLGTDYLTTSMHAPTLDTHASKSRKGVYCK